MPSGSDDPRSGIVARLTYTSRGVQRIPAGHVQPEHAHADLWQVDWVHTGQLEYRFAKRINIITPGDMQFIPPGVLHQPMCEGGCTMQGLKFELSLDFLNQNVSTLNVGSEAPLLEMLANDVFAPRLTLPWDMSLGYLGALLRLAEGIPEEATAWGTAGKDPIARAQRYVLLHLSEGPTVEQMAAAAHLSRSQFTRRFRAAVGCAPLEWIVRQRMLHAAELLRHADMTISAIAGAVGYSDLPTFSKAFRRQMGLWPSSYREQRSAGPGVGSGL